MCSMVRALWYPAAARPRRSVHLIACKSSTQCTIQNNAIKAPQADRPAAATESQHSAATAAMPARLLQVQKTWHKTTPAKNSCLPVTQEDVHAFQRGMARGLLAAVAPGRHEVLLQSPPGASSAYTHSNTHIAGSPWHRCCSRKTAQDVSHTLTAPELDTQHLASWA